MTCSVTKRHTTAQFGISFVCRILNMGLLCKSNKYKPVVQINTKLPNIGIMVVIKWPTTLFSVKMHLKVVEVFLNRAKFSTNLPYISILVTKLQLLFLPASLFYTMNGPAPKIPRKQKKTQNKQKKGNQKNLSGQIFWEIKREHNMKNW